MPYEDVLRRWEDIPPFSAEYAEIAARHITSLDTRIAERVMRLASLYDGSAGPNVTSHLDTRLYEAIAGCNVMSGELGLRRVDVVRLAAGPEPGSGTLVRWFRKDFGSGNGRSPIRGFCLDDAAMRGALEDQARRGAWEAGSASAAGRRTVRQLLLPGEAAPDPGTVVYPAAWSGACGSLHGTTVVEVRLGSAGEDAARMVTEWLRAASTLSVDADTRLLIDQRWNWRRFWRLLGLCAYLLDDPRVSPENDAWQRVLRALHAGLYRLAARRPLDWEPPRAIVRRVGALLEWLAEGGSREGLDLNDAVRAVADDARPRKGHPRLLAPTALHVSRTKLSIHSKELLLRFCDERFGRAPIRQESTTDHFQSAIRAVWYATASGYLRANDETTKEAWRIVRAGYSGLGQLLRGWRLDHILFNLIADPQHRLKRDRIIAFVAGWLNPLTLGITTAWGPPLDAVRAICEVPYVRRWLNRD
jgi:hypothetical protein